MGVVYQALDKERGCRVAVKGISRRDALNIYRLKNEFRQLADISHPNLVTLHELVAEGDDWFFTMELIDGVPFDQYVAAGGPAPRPAGHPVTPDRLSTLPGRVVPDLSATLTQPAIGGDAIRPDSRADTGRLRLVVQQLVEGLSALHAADKLHRDIKPSNVLVTAEGRAVVLDFGLVSSSAVVDPAQQDEERTVGGSVFGTPAYMSPEQAAGETVSPASDWYSLGAMIYEALTGQLPFEGSVLEILRLKEDQEPTPPSELVDGVPDDLDQLCRALLRRRPEDRPNGREILRCLTGNSTPPPARSAAAPARDGRELFVGRESHLAALHRAFGAASTGKPVFALVDGVSGMGKSALVRCFANDLIQSGSAVVLRGRCYERETVPYKAFDNVIDALSRYLMQLPTEEAAALLPRNIHSLARLFPVLRRVRAVSHARRPAHRAVDARTVRDQAFEALRDLLLHISDFQPLVVQIDDLQWGDQDSATLLLHLLSATDAPPVLFVGAYRRDEAQNSPFLRTVLGAKDLYQQQLDVRRISVDGLGAQEAEHLAMSLLQDLPNSNALMARTIAAEAEGVPFFITELVEHARTSQVNPTPIGAISLDDVIRSRIGRMSEPAQQLLRVLAVAAGPIEQAVAAQAAGLEPSDRKALLTLRAARLVRTQGTRQTDSAETYHDRVRETVVADLPPAVVRDLHSRIADAIETWGVGDAERLVGHYEGAGDGGRAGETAIQAARAAADKLAFARAAQLYERALSLLAAADELRPQLLWEYGDALANAGRGAKAAEAYLAAAEQLEAVHGQRLRRMATQQLLRSGHWDDARERVTGLLAEVGVRLPANTVHAVLDYATHRARLKMMGTKLTLRDAADVPRDVLGKVDALGSVYREIAITLPVIGASLQLRYVRAALEAGEPNRVLRALSWNCITECMMSGSNWQGRLEPRLRQIRELAEQLNHPEAYGSMYIAITAGHLNAGRSAEAEEAARKAESMFMRARGTHWEASVAAFYRLVALEFTGDLSEQFQASAGLARAALEHDDRFTPGLVALAQGNALLAADDPDACLRCIDAQSAILGSRFTLLHHMAFVRRAESLLYQGRAESALAYVEATWPEIKRSHVLRGQLSKASFLYLRARIHGELFRRTGSAQHRQSALKFARGAQQANLAFHDYCKTLEATISATSGRNAEAIETLRGTIDSCVDPRNRVVVYARHQLGKLLGGQEGEAMMHRTALALRQQQIARPERWVGLHVGFLN